jgi:hypothetical protein
VVYSEQKKENKMRKYLRDVYKTSVLDEVIGQLSSFKEILEKSKDSIIESSTLQNFINELNVINQKSSKELQSVPNTDISSVKITNLTREAYKTLNKEYLSKARNYYNRHIDNFNKIRKKLVYVKNWNDIILNRQKRDVNYTEYNDQIVQYQTLEKIIADINNLNTDRINNLIGNFDSSYNKMKSIGNLDLDSETVLKIENNKDKTVNQIDNFRQKLVSLYNIKYSLMDVIDNKFIALYVLKFVHFAILIAALYLTEKLFLEMYMKKVYAENKEPPNIYNMLGILVLIDIGFTLFLLTVLVLLMYINNTPDNSFIINPNLITTFLIDYSVFMVFLSLVTLIIGNIIQMKRYFRYKTEGLRGIRAFKDIILGIAFALTLIPFFSLF